MPKYGNVGYLGTHTSFDVNLGILGTCLLSKDAQIWSFLRIGNVIRLTAADRLTLNSAPVKRSEINFSWNSEISKLINFKH